MIRLPKLNLELASGAFVYGVSGLLNALIAFLLLPLLTRYLTPYEYGIIETFAVVVTLLTGIILAGGNTLLTKEYFNLDGRRRDDYVGNTAGYVVVSGVLAIGAFLVLSINGKILHSPLKIDNALIFWAIVVSLSNAFISVMLTVLQLERKSRLFAVFVNAMTVFDIAVSLFLVVVLKMHWQGRIGGIVCSALLFFAISFLFFRRRKIRVKIPARYVATVLLVSPPFILAHMSGWINEMIDRVMINNLLGLHATGIYAIGARFGMVIMLMQEAFGRVWFPFFYQNVRQETPQRDRLIVRHTYLYVAGLVLLSLVNGFFGKYLLCLVVDRRFYSAGDFVFLISMGYCFYGIWRVFIGYLIYKERIKTYSGIVVVAAVLNITLNYVLIRKIGLIGAAWAVFISFAAGAALTVVCAIKIHPMPWALGKDPEG